MITKTIPTIGRYAAKKIGNKAIDKAVQKIDEPYKKLKYEAFAIKPLNVGEKETIKCLQNPHNSLDYCKSVGDKVRKTYHKTRKYK